MGAITEVVRRYVPATYYEMLSATLYEGSPRLFATSDLQALADYVKFRLFATVVTESEESTAFNPFERQFIGKLTTLQFIPAAIDYWDTRLAAKTTTGTNEVIQFRDHRKGLINLFEVLSEEVKKDSDELGFTFKLGTLVPKVTYGDNGRGILITEDPSTFPEPFGTAPTWLDLLPWRVD